MRKLYEKKEILFAVLWIVLYCVVMTPVKGQFGYESVVMVLVLAAFAAGITAFVKANHLGEKYGLTGWPENMKRYLFFLPIWILATGNLWDGFALSFRGGALVCATLSMILVGYVEEMLFRGFLFRAMLSEDRAAVAVTVTAITFGLGHIVNLFAGQATPESFAQIIFAIAWGFLLTMAVFRSGSLLPCIIAHAMIDVFSLYGADKETADWIYIGITAIVAAGYCIYLSRLQERDTEKERK
ncbi:MAG: CPBP family intramembrane metalloprotease [Lachnospiraceae bacterium]|nr:CPBP family intramembrane metalloprotease [Lachnospiraceae bacterium]